MIILGPLDNPEESSHLKIYKVPLLHEVTYSQDAAMEQRLLQGGGTLLSLPQTVTMFKICSSPSSHFIWRERGTQMSDDKTGE